VKTDPMMALLEKIEEGFNEVETVTGVPYIPERYFGQWPRAVTWSCTYCANTYADMMVYQCKGCGAWRK
jgi:hypothetical protein